MCLKLFSQHPFTTASAQQPASCTTGPMRLPIPQADAAAAAPAATHQEVQNLPPWQLQKMRQGTSQEFSWTGQKLKATPPRYPTGLSVHICYIYIRGMSLTAECRMPAVLHPKHPISGRFHNVLGILTTHGAGAVALGDPTSQRSQKRLPQS